jgi:hypothetical protein
LPGEKLHPDIAKFSDPVVYANSFHDHEHEYNSETDSEHDHDYDHEHDYEHEYHQRYCIEHRDSE